MDVKFEQDILHYKELGFKKRMTISFGLFAMLPLFLLTFFILSYIFDGDSRVSSLTFIVISSFMLIFMLLTALWLFGSIERYLFDEGSRLEPMKGKIIFSGRFENNAKDEVYKMMLVPIIVIFFYSYAAFYYLVQKAEFESQQPFILFAITAVMLVVTINYRTVKYKYIWVYQNGIGVENGMREVFLLKIDIEKMILDKRNSTLSIKIIPKYDLDIVRELIGVKTRELYSIMIRTFPELIEEDKVNIHILRRIFK